MRLSNIDGTTRTSFSFGLGANQFTVDIINDSLVISNGKGIKASFTPESDDDLTNLAAVKSAVEAAQTAAKKYTDEIAEQITAGEFKANIMLDPLPITHMNMQDSYSIALGSLPANKFIDRIIFEVTEPFVFSEDKKFDLSIGTFANKEAFLPKIDVGATLGSTYVINIMKTLAAETELFLYISLHSEPVDPPDPDPGPPVDPDFEQRIDNLHTGVDTSFNTDASGRIFNMTFSGTDLTGEVIDKETFGDQVSGNYMDFGINLNLSVGKQYRVVQQNPALELYNGLDEFVSQVEGVWTKSKTYTRQEGEEFLYKFLLGQSESLTDYVHIYVYEITEDGDVGTYTYHIKNGLNFAGVEPLETYSRAPLVVNSLSINETPIGIVKEKDDLYHITMSGNVNSRMAEMPEALKLDNVKETTLSFRFQDLTSTSGYRVLAYAPAFKHFYGLDNSIRTFNGVYYMDMVVEGPMTNMDSLITIPITEDSDYPITVILVDLDTRKCITAIANVNISFMEDASAPKAKNINVAAFNLSDTPSLQATGDSGSALLRVLSF